MTTQYAVNPEQCLLPLFIGVTGHRDIPGEDVPLLKQKVRSILEYLRDSCPSTPLTLISPLAEAGERLAAETALELGLGLIVPLPVHLEQYEKEFSGELLNQFRALLARASLSPMVTPDGTGAAELPRGECKTTYHRTAAHFTVKHSQVLIALWDGDTSATADGTSQVVRMQLEGSDPCCADTSALFTPLQTGPLFFIPTRRAKTFTSQPDREFIEKHCSKNEAPEGVHFLFPLSDDGLSIREDEHFRAFSCIERYNRDSRDIYRLLPDFDDEREQSAKSLMSPGINEPFTPVELSSSAMHLLGSYAHADTLARQFQKQTYGVLLLLASLVPFIVFFFETYSNVTASIPVIAAYLLFLALAYGAHALTQRQGASEKFLDYRALAEGLRVCLFWRLAGIGEDTAQFYLTRQQSELDWIRYAIRTRDLLAYGGVREEATVETARIVRECWIEDQKGYYGRTAGKQKMYADRFDAIAAFLFRLGFFAVTPAMLIIHGLKLGEESLDLWMQVAPPVTFIIAGVVKYYAERMLYTEQAKQYARMYSVFSKCLRLLDAAGDDPVRQREIILAAGREALTENGDWVLMHRERPIEVPQG